MKVGKGCETCKFWDEIGVERVEDFRAAPCVRFPPVKVSGEGLVDMVRIEEQGHHIDPSYFMFPITSDISWCGEYVKASRFKRKKKR